MIEDFSQKEEPKMKPTPERVASEQTYERADVKDRYEVPDGTVWTLRSRITATGSYYIGQEIKIQRGAFEGGNSPSMNKLERAMKDKTLRVAGFGEFEPTHRFWHQEKHGFYSDKSALIIQIGDTKDSETVAIAANEFSKLLKVYKRKQEQGER